MKIVFFGAPHFSKEILKGLLQNNISIDTVITHPDQPIGRKKELQATPTKLFAKKNNISVKEFYKLDKNAIKVILETKPDLFVVASYGAILPIELIAMPKFGALNVHPSLLPKFRGASPIQTALLNGKSRTGTTIMLMDEGMDTGNIVKQAQISIHPTETYPELEQRLISLSSKLLTPIIKEIIKTNHKPTNTKQDNNKATYSKMIKKQDGLINWDNSAINIYNQWRAFYNWPKINTFYNNQKLTLTEIELSSKNAILDNTNTPSGKVYINKERNLLIRTQKDFIKVNHLQLAGKNELSASDFLNGQPNFVGVILK
jgi:methionyl-tRNA formyltransferase